MPNSSGTTLDLDHLIRLRQWSEHWDLRPAPSDSKTGGLAGRKRGHGSDIRELRPYAEGDDLRHIDAMASARTGKRQVRSFHEDQDKTVLLIADFRSPMLWGTRQRFRSVAAGEALAIAGWRAIADGGKVGLLAANDSHSHHLPPQARDRAMMRVAGSMARAHAEAWELARRPAIPPMCLDSLLERAARLLPSGATIYLATALDHPGDDFDDIAGSLARKTHLVFLLIHDGMESEPVLEPLPYVRLDTLSASAPVWGRLDPIAEDPRRAMVPVGATLHDINASAPDAECYALGSSHT